LHQLFIWKLKTRLGLQIVDFGLQVIESNQVVV